MSLARGFPTLVACLAVAGCVDATIGDSPGGDSVDAGDVGGGEQPDAGAPQEPDGDTGGGGGGGGGGTGGGNDESDGGTDDQGPSPVTLTHNDDTETIATDAANDDGEPFVGCFFETEGDVFVHTAMDYYKVFDPDDFDIADDVVLEQIHVGVLEALSTSVAIEATVTLSAQDDPLEPEPQSADEIISFDIEIPADGSVEYPQIHTDEIPDDVVAPADRALLLEFSLDSGVNEDGVATDAFNIGVNFEGESRESFVRAPDAPGCNLEEPTRFSDIEDPDDNNLGDRDWVVAIDGIEGG